MKLIRDNVLSTYATFSPLDRRWRNLPSAMRCNLYLSSRYLFGMRNISKVNNITLTYNSLNSWFTHFHHESQLINKNIIHETHSEKNTAKALFFIEKKKKKKYFQRYLWFYSLPVQPECILNLVYCFASVLSFVGRVKVGIRNGKKSTCVFVDLCRNRSRPMEHSLWRRDSVMTRWRSSPDGCFQSALPLDSPAPARQLSRSRSVSVKTREPPLGWKSSSSSGSTVHIAARILHDNTGLSVHPPLHAWTTSSPAGSPGSESSSQVMTLNELEVMMYIVFKAYILTRNNLYNT